MAMTFHVVDSDTLLATKSYLIACLGPITESPSPMLEDCSKNLINSSNYKATLTGKLKEKKASPIERIYVHSDSNNPNQPINFNPKSASKSQSVYYTLESDYHDNEYPKIPTSINSSKNSGGVFSHEKYDLTITVNTTESVEVMPQLAVDSVSNINSPISDESDCNSTFEKGESNSDSDSKSFKLEDYYLSSSNVELGIAGTITMRPIDSITVFPSPKHTRFFQDDHQSSTSIKNFSLDDNFEVSQHSGLEPIVGNTHNSCIVSDSESDLCLETAKTSLKSKSPISFLSSTHDIFIKNKTAVSKDSNYGLDPLAYMCHLYEYNASYYNSLKIPIKFPHNSFYLSFNSIDVLNLNVEKIKNLRIQLANPEMLAVEYLNLLKQNNVNLNVLLESVKSNKVNHVELIMELIKLMIDLIQYIPRAKFPFYAYYIEFSNYINLLVEVLFISQNHYSDDHLYNFTMGSLFYLFNLLTLSSINLIFERVFKNDNEDDSMFRSTIKLEILKICIVINFKNSTESPFIPHWKFNEFYEFNDKLTKYMNKFETSSKISNKINDKLQELNIVWKGITETNEIILLNEAVEETVTLDSGVFCRNRKMIID